MSTSDVIQGIYIAYYGRFADAGGLAYWSARLDAEGGNLDNVINYFGNSPEAESLFGSMTNTDKINYIYNTLFGRDGDADGVAYYTNMLTAGTASAADIAKRIADGATGTDATAIANKVAAANTLTATVSATEYVGDAAAAAGRSLIAQVTDTVTAPTSTWADALATGGQTEGSTFTLTTSTTAYDSIVSTAGSDTFDATTVDSLQSSDRITDIAVSDNDVLNAVVTSASAAPTLTSVETLNLTAKYGTGGIDLASSTGYSNVNLASSIASGSMTVSNVAEPVTVTAGTNVSTLTVTAKATSGTGGKVVVNSGSATAVTLTGNSGADTFDVAMGAVGTLNMNAADAGNDTYTATLKNGANTVALSMGAGTDAATLNLAGGTLTLTGNTANETLNIVSTGAANTVNATATVATGATPGTIVISGDKDITIKDTAANFNAVIVTDSTTAGTTTLQLTAPGAAASDLSKANVDLIDLLATTNNTAALKFASGAHVQFSDGTASVKIQGTSTSDTLSINANETTAKFEDGGTDFATIYLSASEATTVTAVMDATATSFVLSGSNNITFAATSKAKAIDGSGLTGALTVTFDGTDDIATVTGGSGNDTFNIATPSADITISGGAGTDILKLTAATDIATAHEASTITGFEVFDVNGSTLTLTQKQLFTNGNTFTLTDTAGSGTLAIVSDGASSNVFDLSGVQFAQGVAAPTITIEGDSTGANSIVGTSAADEITGGGAADTISGGAGADTISGGAGNDVITTGAGADVINLDDVTTAGIDSITDFTAGTDKIDAMNGSGATAATALVDKGIVDTATYTTLDAYLATFATAGVNETVVAEAYSFTYGSDKYLLVDVATAGYAAGDDALVKITGISGTLAAADILSA